MKLNSAIPVILKKVSRNETIAPLLALIIDQNIFIITKFYL